jgi:PAS domain S-box-containing protein
MKSSNDDSNLHGEVPRNGKGTETAPFAVSVRYGLAILSVGVALGTGLLLQNFHFRVPAASLLLIAVAIASWYAGRGPAVLAVILATISCYWFFVEPVRTIYIGYSDLPFFLIFTAFAILLCWFGTVRRRIEADVRGSEERFRTLVRFSFDVYWESDAQHRFTRQEFSERLTDAPTRGSEIGKRRWEIPYLEPDEESWRQHRATMDAHLPFRDFELARPTPDGGKRYVSVSGLPVFDEAGRFLGYRGVGRHITERKRAEEHLRRLNRELRAISDCNQALLRATDEPTLLTDICRIVCEEAGYRMTWVGYAEHDETKTVHPVAWAGAEEGYLATARITWADTERGRGPAGTTIRSGKTCYVQDYAVDPLFAPWRESAAQRGFRSGIVLPLKEEQGTVFGCLCIYSAQPNAFTVEEIRLLEELAGDLAFGIVTLRSAAAGKRAEEALRQSEAYLAEAQRLSHTGSWAFDVASDKYVYASEECARIFEFDGQQGFPSREAISRLIHPEDWSGVNDAFEKTLWEKSDTASEFRITLPSGTVKHVHAIRHPILNDAGEVGKLVGTVIDVTDRKRAEDALRDSETRFRTFVDHAADAFFMLDERGTIIDVNQAACESLGYTRQELLGMKPMTFHLDSDRAQMESAAEQAAAGETVVDKHWHRRKDGALFPVEVHTSLVSYGGHRFLLKVARDITDRVRADEQHDRLHQLEADLAHINRVSMMGELAASIAHELGQPLSGVVTNGSACLRWLARDAPNLEEARETAHRIVRDGKRAGEIIARIRALTTKAETPNERLALNGTIQDVLALVANEATRGGVVIRTQFADDLAAVAGDRVQLQQVMLNLVLNGIEAMSGVSDRSREVVITTQNLEPDQVQVTVEDSGIGLDPNTCDKIFEAFYTTKSAGMGMGLSISRSIVQAHGGRLWATAKDGPGTRFHFTLPKYREDESHA